LLGRYATLSGEARLAVDDYFVRALLIQNRVGDAQGRGEVFHAMGFAHERLGELDIARQHYRNAVELRSTAGDARGVARSLANIARLDMIQGDYAAARKEIGRSLDEMTKLGDLAAVADLRNEFGVLEEEAGNYRGALEQYREALRIKQELGEGGLAESYVNLAFAYLVLGEFDNAAAFTRNARAEFEESKDPHGEVTVLELEGELALARGKWDDAARAYVEELEMTRELDAPFSEAVAEGGLALVAFLQGRPGAALDGYQRALDILAPLEDLRGLAEFRLRRAAVFMAINLPQKAMEDLDAIKTIENEGNLGQRAEYYRLRGAAQASAGNVDDAKAQLAKARDLAERSGSEALKLRIDLARVKHLPAKDAPDPAEVADRAARLDHAPMRLEALALLAERRLWEKRPQDATDAARMALRPPVRVDPWIDNWRLNSLLWRGLNASGTGETEEAAETRRRARAQFAQLVSETPESLRTGLEALAETEAADVGLR
jgi:tetratricopeptide (TPR) repeat protein